MSRLLVVVSLALLLSLVGCAPQLIVAAREGDTKAVLALLDQGTDVNVRDNAIRNGATALGTAAYNGHVETVRVLLERGADINMGAYGFSPIHLAAMSGHAQIVRMLIEKGAVVADADGYGKTPLKEAEEHGHTAVAQLLRQVEARELGLAQPAAERKELATVPTPTMSAVQSDVDRVPAVKTVTKKHAYAVVIGIEQYREKLPKADYADRDAKLVGEYLTKVMGYPEENVVVRTNEMASMNDLVKYLESWLPNNVDKDSPVFIYYSGHGAPNVKTGDAYLVPYDGDPTFVEKTGYPLKKLYAQLESLPTNDITVVLDSCFSGAGGRSVLAEGARPMGLAVEKTVSSGGKAVVLAASSGDQISSTYKEKGHGLLTYYFLKGLQGDGDTNKDGVIELTEIYEYLKPNVQRIARKRYNSEQTPQLLASPELLKRGGGRLLERVGP